MANVDFFAASNALWPSNDSFCYAVEPWLRWYGVFFAIGLFVAIMISCIRIQTYYKIKYELFFYFAIIVVPVSLFGARFWSACIGDLSWENFFNFSKSGGMAIQGGVLASIIAGLIYFPLMLKKPKYHVRCEEGNSVYIRKPSLWIIIDAILPCILIGQAIGRWGNFFNGEIYGGEVSKESLMWLGNIFPNVMDRMQLFSDGVATGKYFEPLFLYESFVNVVLFIVIYFVLPSIKNIRIGVIGSLYLISYGVERTIFETMRASGYWFIGTYILNSLMLLFGIIVFILVQFILPRYREQRILFKWYCYVRKYIIKFLSLKLFNNLNIDWVKKAMNNDPNLEKFGYKKNPIFIRTNEDMLYYANK